MTSSPITGGCQCGSVRYDIKKLGRATICHCRMCQKALGSFYGPLVTALDIEWTRGKPAVYASSNKVTRGFCADCGTPLTYDWGKDVEIAIGSMDNPTLAAPVLQVNIKDKLPIVDALHKLPMRDPNANEGTAEIVASIKSNQHPDHHTTDWPE